MRIKKSVHEKVFIRKWESVHKKAFMRKCSRESRKVFMRKQESSHAKAGNLFFHVFLSVFNMLFLGVTILICHSCS